MIKKISYLTLPLLLISSPSFGGETLSSRLFNLNYSIGAFGYLFLTIIFFTGVFFLFKAWTFAKAYSDPREDNSRTTIKVIVFSLIGGVMCSYTSYVSIMSYTASGKNKDSVFNEFINTQEDSFKALRPQQQQQQPQGNP